MQMQNELLRVEFDGNVFHIRSEDTKNRIKKYLLQLVKSQGQGAIHRTAWTAEEDQYLIDHKDEPLKEVAKAIGRTTKAVGQRRLHLHIADRPIPAVAAMQNPAKVFEV